MEESAAQMQAFFKGRFGLVSRNVFLFGHEGENRLLPFPGSLVIFQGIIITGSLQQACEQGRLGQAQGPWLRAEVDMACFINAGGAGTKIRCVQVNFQNFVFTVIVLEQKGQNEFLGLAGQCPFRCKKGILNDLLANGAAAFYGFTGRKVDQNGPADTNRGDGTCS